MAHSVLVQNLQIVQSAINARFCTQVQIPVIALPDEIKKEKIKAAIREASVASNLADKASLRFLAMKNAVHYAYALGSPDQIVQATHDSDETTHEALVIDYNVAFLGLYLIHLQDDRALQRAHVTLPHLGEARIREDRLAVCPKEIQRAQ